MAVNNVYKEIIKWLEEHNGKMPRSMSQKRHAQMTQEERDEANLYYRWINCEEKDILEQYIEIPIEEIPEEYRNKIATLRKYGQRFINI